ncbi:MAG: endolytic transglycosylase MltG [Patescibacteria group bacterium]|jgi:UPF0755 protein
MVKKTSFPFLKLLFTIVILVVIGFVSGFLWWGEVNKPVNPDDTEEVKVVIPKGYGISAIGELLKQKDLIKSVWGFRLVVAREGLKNQLQAGSYTLSRSQNLVEVAQSLTKGVEDFWVTVPEGKRREEVAKIIADEFATQGIPFSIQEFLEATEDSEGYLFPDTYLLPKYSTAVDVANIMRSTFDKKISEDLRLKMNELGLTLEEVLTLASLVEREAKFEVDRPKIARVLLNRLEIDMPLQIDATVQYAVGQAQCISRIGKECNWWPVIQSTKYSSPYNTYENPGLPPGPICNPGLAVIEAVLNSPDHDYLYYLSEPSGLTHYAETLNEHEANIRLYLD